MDFLQIGKQTHGFLYKQKEHFPTLQGTAHLFEHQKSGATFLFFQAEDDNKVFNITFRTFPENDAGIPHIIEHSVLCGSQKYHVKDPFNELLKGSLHTFLNAMTYADKTMYPIATTNATEFMTLTDVYLDAVFHPNLLASESIFMQEGVRYSMEDQTLAVSGVVYNEMKGAASSAEYILDHEINKALLEGTIFANVSGGLPEAIEDLTYEQLLAFYQKNYHPSNSFLYAYGDVDLLPFLAFLDTNYLSHYDRTDNNRLDFGVVQTTAGVGVRELYYPVSSADALAKRAYVAVSFGLESHADQLEKNAGFQFLRTLLTGTAASPLKNALIEEGLCDDVYIMYDASVKYSAFSIVAKNADTEDGPRIRQRVYEILQDLAENDFNRDFIEGVLSNHEFWRREQNYGSTPRGLMHGIAASTAFVNNWDMMSYLSDTVYKSIQDKAQNGYFRDLIKDLLHHERTGLFIMKPAPQLQQQLDEQAKKRLHQKWTALSEQKKQELDNAQKAFSAWQKEPESPEALAAIPSLTIADLSEKPNLIPSKRQDDYIIHEADTNGIVYTNITFDLSGVSASMYSYCALLCAFLGKCDTKNADYVAISERLLSAAGNFHIYTNSFSNVTSDCFLPKIVLKTKMLEKNLDKVLAIAGDLLGNALLDNEERLLAVIAEEKSSLESRLMSWGHSAAILRALSSFSQEHDFYHVTRGFGYYLFLSSLTHMDAGEIKQQLLHLYARIFTKENCFIGFTAAPAQCLGVTQQFNGFLADLNRTGAEPPLSIASLGFTRCTRQEAFITPAKNNTNVKAADFSALTGKHNGKLAVLSKILDQDYLWNQVRVKGGAYGCGAEFFSTGRMFVYAMRDPHIHQTYQIFDGLADYLEGFAADTRDMTRYIIGTVAYDGPRTHEQKNDVMAGCFFSGITDEFLIRRRAEVLSATAQDIRQFAPVLAGCMKNSSLCTIGNASAIHMPENAALFSQIQTLL